MFFIHGRIREANVTDKELLKWVIDTTPLRDSYSKLDIHNYLKLFYIVTCDNRLILHQETMDMGYLENDGLNTQLVIDAMAKFGVKMFYYGPSYEGIYNVDILIIFFI